MLIKDAEEAKLSGRLPGIRFGFPAVDDFTHGLRYDDGDLMILAGDPGAGKTSVAMACMRMFAMSESRYTSPLAGLFMSMEMGERATASRYLQMMAEVTQQYLRSGIDKPEIDVLSKSAARERDLPLHLNFTPGGTLPMMREEIARMVEKHNVRLVCFDHLRYMNLPRANRDPNERDAELIRYVKQDIAKSLGVAVIVIAHTNKSSSYREDKTPRMSDLSGSQQLAGQADYIGFVYRPILHASEEEITSGVYEDKEAYLVWAKNRNDRTGDHRFRFDGSTMRVEDWKYTPISQQVHPDQSLGIWS